MVIVVTADMIARYDHANHKFTPLEASRIPTEELRDALTLVRQAVVDDLAIMIHRSPQAPLDSPAATAQPPRHGDA